MRSNGTEIVKRFYLDEIAFLAGGKHSMKVIGGNEGCQYFFFDIDKFMELSDDNPNFLRPMARQLNVIIKDNNACLGQTDAFKLQIAVEKNELDKVKEILGAVKVDLNVSCPQSNGMTKGTGPIHIAARNNNSEILRYLLDNGADINLIDNLGNTVAHIAAKRNYFELLKILKDRGANFSLVNARGKTPYDLAKEKNYEQITDWFEKLSRE